MGESPEQPDRATLRRRGAALEWATIGWNSVEVFVAIGAGLAAHSLALVAFGLDSCVELLGSLVVLWHIGPTGGAADATPARTRRALRLLAACFFALAVYLAGAAARDLIVGGGPLSSPVGTAFMACTVAVMFGLAWAKRRVGVGLGDEPLLTNASMTFLDGCLATGVLVALIAASVLGWHWTDPLTAAVVAVLAATEAARTWRASGTPAGPAR